MHGEISCSGIYTFDYIGLLLGEAPGVWALKKDGSSNGS